MLSNNLKDYAVSAGIGVFGSDLFVRKYPDSPDDMVCIYDDAGIVPTGGHDYDMDVFGSKWLVRGDYTYASNKILEIHRKVSGLMQDFGQINVMVTHIQSEPQFVENDDKGRAVYSAHYLHYCSIGGNVFRTEK